MVSSQGNLEFDQWVDKFRSRYREAFRGKCFAVLAIVVIFLFPSRDRGAFRFNYARIHVEDMMLFWFPSRDREVFRFKGNNKIQLQACAYVSISQSRDFGFQVKRVAQTRPSGIASFDLVIERRLESRITAADDVRKMDM